jgi:hypothetical protein
MIATRQRRRRRTVRRRDETRRLRRRTGLALAVALTAALALVTYRSGSSPSPPPTLAAATPSSLAPDGQPTVETLATYGATQGLVLRVPVRQQRITAIVYHGIGDANVVPLQPAGHQLDASFLSRLADRLFGGSSTPGPRYYIDSSDAGPDTGSVDVGAAAGTTVWSPIDGVIASIQPYELSGKRYGSVIQIRPDAAPAVTITMQAIQPLHSHPIQVGDLVTAARSPLGTIVDLSGVLDQTVARYTSDAGNHVSISIGPSPGASPIL